MPIFLEQHIHRFIKQLKKEPVLYFIDKFLEAFPAAELYIVGGSVRDMLLFRKDIGDYDFVVRNIAAEKLQVFLSQFGKVNFVGKNFGVFKFSPRLTQEKNCKTTARNIDIALPRKERSSTYSGNRRDFIVESNPALPIEEDLSRRDFTINAMAIEMRARKLFDCFDGLGDLKRGVIRTVGNPHERFREDYSRMLRGIRFTLQLDFHLEAKTSEAIRQNMHCINLIFSPIEGVAERVVSYEVISQELLKSISYHPGRALEMFDEYGIIKELLWEVEKMKECPQPENYHSEGNVWNHTRLCLKELEGKKFKKEFSHNPSVSPELILGVLFHDLGKPYTIETPEKDGTERIRFHKHDIIGAQLAKKICERLRFSSGEDFRVKPENIFWLVKNHLLLMHGTISEMKNRTIEKYFFSKEFPSQDLLKLIYIDSISTLPVGKNPDMKNFQAIKKRIRSIQKLSSKKLGGPDPLLNGDDIMETFRLSPGEEIGKLLGLVREEQLSGRIKTKKEALQWLSEKISDAVIDLEKEK